METGESKPNSTNISGISSALSGLLTDVYYLLQANTQLLRMFDILVIC